jgi:glycosyltransferase involved in cell wall biosynthesis
VKSKIYITNLPSFYKLNLLNGIAEHIELFTIFTNETSTIRNSDFYKGNRNFRFKSLEGFNFFKKIFFIQSLVKKIQYDEIIVCGWDQLLFWLIIWLTPKNKNSIVIESSIYESKTNGLKGFIKKFFLFRISKAYCSGKSQAAILKNLGFRGEIIITKGVGIFNIVKQPPFIKIQHVYEYVYVGRFSPEKNLKLLIETFNNLPQFNLNLIGFGPQEQELKSIANSNVIFHGAISNFNLSEVLKKFHVLILPSISEPWGLVVEEALNNGLPVIVSDKVGCVDEIVTDDIGLIFTYNDSKSLEDKIYAISNSNFYNSLRLIISQMDFEKVAQQQINCYI